MRTVILTVLVASVLATGAPAQVLNPLPTAAPFDIMGPMQPDCRTQLAGNQSWFLQYLPRAAYNTTPLACRGQHIVRADGACPNIQSGQVCWTQWFADPTRPFSTPPVYAGWEVRATMRFNNHTVDSGPGGLIQIALRKNQSVQVQLVKVPDGYTMPAEWARARSVSIADLDVWSLVELAKR